IHPIATTSLTPILNLSPTRSSLPPLPSIDKAYAGCCLRSSEPVNDEQRFAEECATMATQQGRDPKARPNMSQLNDDGSVVVGRGKTGWNKLLRKPSLSGKEKTIAEASAAKAEMVHDEKEEEMVYAEESDQLVNKREEKGKQRRVVDPLPKEKITEEEEEEEECESHGMFHGAGKFLLAGGVAGAATAPFDRLKVYLITSQDRPPPDPNAPPSPCGRKYPKQNSGRLLAATSALWKQGGGVKVFWTGNGLNIIKIFPESAIKFLSYESAKRIFAEYWDKVPDQTMISNSSRFVAGGIGGVISQFVIYPIETVKVDHPSFASHVGSPRRELTVNISLSQTRVMSSTGGTLKGNALILSTIRDMWRSGGLPRFFRGLPAGLIGVFPYSAIDMSTYEGIKLAYGKWTGQNPEFPSTLVFGALSGGIGATSVYPLNLVRTRLQAQGTPAHPQVYSGIADAARQCYVREGWRGFYKGLTPTLVKVIPAVAISYAVYEKSKKVLFGLEPPHVVDHDSTEES
ncbi:mitochondrial carrier protein, partial [Pseudohyphozyma bogoriensis]